MGDSVSNPTTYRRGAIGQATRQRASAARRARSASSARVRAGAQRTVRSLDSRIARLRELRDAGG